MSETLRRALADFHEADESDFDAIPLEEVARELADRVSSELANTDIVDLSDHIREDVTSGATFVPVVHKGMVGYRCQHSDGREVFIYFNPSDDSDDGQANVFVYEGEHFDPSKDAPSHHYNIEWPGDRETAAEEAARIARANIESAYGDARAALDELRSPPGVDPGDAPMIVGVELLRLCRAYVRIYGEHPAVARVMNEVTDALTND